MGIPVIESRVFLIGGTSHTGKSTLAQALASRLGWHYRSTDKLARHPGRPWQVPPKQVPDHVADHYRSLDVDALIADVVRHYRDNVWPLVEEIVAAHASDPTTDRLVLEGSAILPELAITLQQHNIAAIWLTAGDECLAERMYSESHYGTKSPREKYLIDKFLQRTWHFNRRIVDTVERLGLACVDVEPRVSLETLVDVCLAEITRPRAALSRPG